MVLKEKVSERLIGIPVRIGERAEAMVPIATRDLDHSSYTLERMRYSITDAELYHYHFPSAHEASIHAHLLEKWERLPINNDHYSPRHDHNGRLFEKFRQAASFI
jgi:hypothetical protein